MPLKKKEVPAATCQRRPESLSEAVLEPTLALVMDIKMLRQHLRCISISPVFGLSDLITTEPLVQRSALHGVRTLLLATVERNIINQLRSFRVMGKTEITIFISKVEKGKAGRCFVGIQQ